MLQFPVRFRHSLLVWPPSGRDRRPASGFIAKISAGARSIGSNVDPGHDHRLELTPQDSFTLGIDPSSIVEPRSAAFLGAEIRIEFRGDSFPFEGTVSLIPRELLLTASDLQSLSLKPGQQVFVASNTARPTIFGNCIVRLNDRSYFSVPRPEAESALLTEADTVYVSAAHVTNQSTAEVPALPVRFLNLPSKSRPLITEAHVWQAILKHKKIWISRNTRMTPAARELGKARDVFEFEL